MSTKVYRYGLRAPIEGEAIAREQMKFARAYREDLTRLHRALRSVTRDVIEAQLVVAEPTTRAVAAVERVIVCKEAIRKSHINARAKNHADELAAAVLRCDRRSDPARRARRTRFDAGLAA